MSGWLRLTIIGTGLLVFQICLYAFLLGNKVFEGKFENDFVAWYFLAKGIFCFLSICMGVMVLDRLMERKKRDQ